MFHDCYWCSYLQGKLCSFQYSCYSHYEKCDLTTGQKRWSVNGYLVRRLLNLWILLCSLCAVFSWFKSVKFMDLIYFTHAGILRLSLWKGTWGTSLSTFYHDHIYYVIGVPCYSTAAIYHSTKIYTPEVEVVIIKFCNWASWRSPKKLDLEIELVLTEWSGGMLTQARPADPWKRFQRYMTAFTPG